MYPRTRRICTLIGAVMLALPACGRSSPDRADSTAAVQLDSAAAGGMSGMRPGIGPDNTPATTGPTIMPPMSAEMTAHMAEMKAADGSRLVAMVWEHRKLVNGLLAQMNDPMRNMNVSVSPAWTALTDSIGGDLAAMSKASGA